MRLSPPLGVGLWLLDIGPIPMDAVGLIDVHALRAEPQTPAAIQPLHDLDEAHCPDRRDQATSPYAYGVDAAVDLFPLDGDVCHPVSIGPWRLIPSVPIDAECHIGIGRSIGYVYLPSAMQRVRIDVYVSGGEGILITRLHETYA